MTVRIKRIYETSSNTDGYRVLIDRIWPRGVSKEEANLNEWLKEIAPSTELREWYGHDTARFTEFKKRYNKELNTNTTAVNHLKEVITSHSMVTLLFAARENETSNAQVLLEYLT